MHTELGDMENNVCSTNTDSRSIKILFDNSPKIVHIKDHTKIETIHIQVADHWHLSDPVTYSSWHI